jgi:hypothetical protein
MTFVGLKKRGGQGVDLSTEVISGNDPTLLQLTKSRFDCWCRSRRVCWYHFAFADGGTLEESNILSCEHKASRYQPVVHTCNIFLH